MNILAIGAHPDDIELGCAPVLIKEVKSGNHVKHIVLSRGEAGSSGTPKGREQEARDAARVIGASIDFWDFGGDCHVQYLPEHAFQIAAEIRRFKPQIVLAPHTDENQHPDHSVAGRLTRDACRFARYGGLSELTPSPVHKVTSLYFYTITQHVGFAPDTVIDVGDVMVEWEAVINCHQSQTKSKNYLELQKTAARLLGLTIGTDYAVALYRNEPLRLNKLSDLTLSSRNF